MPAGKKSPARARPIRGRTKASSRPEEHLPPQNPLDPEVRMDKIEKLRDAVQRGDYKVPASEVAAKILEEMRRR